MSFGPSKQEKTALAEQTNLAKQSTANSTNLFNQGTAQMQAGQGNIQSGTNFLNTILGGNQANTTALLRPDIDRIRAGTQNALQTLSTLMPRGGGRSSALFSAAYAPTAAVNNLFSGARTTAATALPQIGLQQQQIGANLFNPANTALGLGIQGNQNVFQDAFQNRQYGNSMWGSLGSGIFNLATLPFGGSGLLGGLMGKVGGLFGGGGGGGGVQAAPFIPAPALSLPSLYPPPQILPPPPIGGKP